MHDYETRMRNAEDALGKIESALDAYYKAGMRCQDTQLLVKAIGQAVGMVYK